MPSFWDSLRCCPACCAGRDHDAETAPDTVNAPIIDKEFNSPNIASMKNAQQRLDQEVRRHEEMLGRPPLHSNLEVGQTSSMTMHRKRLSMNGFEPHSMVDSFGLFDVNLVQEPDKQKNIFGYYNLCLCTDLMVTLSCFSVWAQNKKTNQFAKVIPVLAEAPEPNRPRTRVFFFDDNIDLNSCTAQSAGICNLRNVQTGEFIDFSEGVNGFRRHHVGQHTQVHASPELGAVMVQANILDAMEDAAYFTKILQKFSELGDKLLVYMDVNSTIVCIDTVTDKSMTEILLGTMFEFVELRPTAPFDFSWESRKPLRIDKPITFKQIAKKLAKDDPAYYNGFYTESRCQRFFEQLVQHGEVKWLTRDGKLSLSQFLTAYHEYCKSISNGATELGITNSWFECYKYLSDGGHSVVINSFGVDTRKVLGQTVPEQSDVLHVTVNYKLWEKRDQTKFEEEYGVKCRRRSMLEMDDATRELMSALVQRGRGPETTAVSSGSPSPLP